MLCCSLAALTTACVRESVGEMVGRRILVVDDDDDLREVIADVLTDEGHTVTTATNGREALDMLRDTDVLPDLVLLDLVMPELDGYEFIAQAEKRDRFSKLRVVIFSANHEELPRMNAYARLRKPFAIEELLTIVQR